MNTWQLQEAKSHLSELVKKAMDNKPQQITLRGKPVVVMISKAEFDRIVHSQLSLVEFMRQSPLTELDIELTPDLSFTREVDL